MVMTPDIEGLVGPKSSGHAARSHIVIRCMVVWLVKSMSGCVLASSTPIFSSTELVQPIRSNLVDGKCPCNDDLIGAEGLIGHVELLWQLSRLEIGPVRCLEWTFHTLELRVCDDLGQHLLPVRVYLSGLGLVLYVSSIMFS